MFEIEDRMHIQSMLEVRITTPSNGMGYDQAVVDKSAELLTAKLSECTSSGFTQALERALHRSHSDIDDIGGT